MGTVFTAPFITRSSREQLRESRGVAVHHLIHFLHSRHHKLPYLALRHRQQQTTTAVSTTAAARRPAALTTTIAAEAASAITVAG